MRPIFFFIFITVLTGLPARAADYFPPKGAWQTHAPGAEGFDPAKLKAAIDFAVANESKVSASLDGVIDQRDLRITIPLQFAGPYSDPIGPLKPHAPANGIVIRHGYIVAEWGDTDAVDMTHSVTKTFISSVAGIAFDRHMIRDVNDRIIDYVRPSPDFLLPQTSRSPGIRCCARPAAGSGRCGASRGGPTAPARMRGTNSPPGRRRSARSGNIPMCGSMPSRWR